ncbi:MAG: ABC transporter substrate-binding protein [Actinomycetia bacterium]|nr:ABC transporter substrate-binding protein [Actinomycetes bacterium]
MMHRSRIAAVLTVVGALVLTACGMEQAPQTAESPPSGETRAITHEYGQADIPVDPQRVVVLHDGLILGAALLLDAPIVGYTGKPAGEPISPHFDEAKLADATDVGWHNPLNIEAVAATQPDLIISQTGFVDSDEYRALSQIAPTVVFKISGTTPWKEASLQVGDVLGDTSPIEQGIADYEARIEQVREAFGDRAGNTTVTLANLRSLTDIRVVPRDWCSATTLQDVGLMFPPGRALEDAEGVSVELLPSIDADMLFYFVGSSTVDTEAEEATVAIQQNPLWDTLGAVQNDQAHQVDQSHWFSCGSLQAQNLVLDDVERILGAA